MNEIKARRMSFVESDRVNNLFIYLIYYFIIRIIGLNGNFFS